MSSRRRKPESLWARKEEAGPQNEPKDFDSNFLGDNSPKRSNSKTNDVLMSDDFSTQGNENMLMDNDKHKMKTSRDRDRSRSRSSSPHRTRGPHRDRTRGRDSGRDRASPSRGSGSNRPEYLGSRDRNSNSKSSDGYKKETRDYHRNDRIGYNDQDHRRQSNQSIKTPCRFFIMGNCNRNNCKFSHDPNPKFETFPNSGPDFDEKNKSWNDPSWNNPESGGFDDVSRDMDTNSNQDSQFIRDNSQFDGQQIGQSISSQFPTNLNGNGPIEASRNDNPQVTSETLANALELLHSLPNSVSGPVDSAVGQPVKTGLPETQTLVEPVKNPEVNENPTGQPDNKIIGKPEVLGKVEEGNIGNDEKAMRVFKTALVEFVKEILKPTWKEGKMDREVYKTIVKKVVEKVTSTIQGNQIPKTQEKIDQYLSFSKSKITKLVEAYVGKFQKA